MDNPVLGVDSTHHPPQPLSRGGRIKEAGRISTSGQRPGSPRTPLEGVPQEAPVQCQRAPQSPRRGGRVNRTGSSQTPVTLNSSPPPTPEDGEIPREVVNAESHTKQQVQIECFTMGRFSAVGSGSIRTAPGGPVPASDSLQTASVPPHTPCVLQSHDFKPSLTRRPNRIEAANLKAAAPIASGSQQVLVPASSQEPS